jgi:isopenicillin N synthase-like dioxygenase
VNLLEEKKREPTMPMPPNPPTIIATPSPDGTDEFVGAVDLSPWYDGDRRERAAVALAVDESLRRAGFVVVTGHGVDLALAAKVRRQYAALFALDPAVKDPWRAKTLGSPGWVPFGMEANGYISGENAAPDLKESFVLTTGTGTGTGAGRGRGGGEPGRLVEMNPWLADVDSAVADWSSALLTELERLHLDILEVMGSALGLATPSFFADRARGALNNFNINWYPPASLTGMPAADQYRIGAHTDFGSITILDRQPGIGGLQVQKADGGWVDAPWVPESLTVNVGDLLQLWSAGRWRSAMHRVLPPSADAPDEALISLIYFCEPQADTVVAPLDGSDAFAPQRAGDYLAARLARITV